MAVYVDDLFGGPGGRWCHMMTDQDSLDELHAMAARIGLKRSWFQVKSSPHYDLRPRQRSKAIALGVQPVSAKKLVELCVIAKREKKQDVRALQEE